MFNKKSKISTKIAVFILITALFLWLLPTNLIFGGTTDPVTTDPVTTDPITTDSVTTDPVTTDSVTTDPVTTDSVTTDPITTDSVTTDPVTTDPVTTDPVTTDSVTTDPEITLPPDTTPPVIALKGDNPVTIEVGSKYKDAGATALDDIDGDITDTIKVVSTVDTITAGTYKVTYSVNDKAGNNATEVTRIVEVIIIDTTPVVTLNPYSTDPSSDNTPSYTGSVLGTKDIVSIEYRVGGVDSMWTAIDSFTVGPNPDFTFTTPFLSEGFATIDVRATDKAGNVSELATDTLMIDTECPVITLIGDNPVIVEVGSIYTDAGATAADSIDGDLTGSITSDSTVDTNTVGSYKVTYNVSDKARNAATKVIRVVNVFNKATVATSKLDYLPKDYVLVTGSGWLPDETVKLDFHETLFDLFSQQNITYYTVADSEGKINDIQYLIELRHLGASFILTATGLTSGLTAQTTFTDGGEPTVLGVTSSSANGNYTTGQTVPIQVTFSTPVTVTGTPRIILSTGSPVTTAVNYSSGSGTDTLTFDYTVAAGNTSTDLDYSSASALTLNGGTIVDAGPPNKNAILTLATPGTAGSLGANKAIAINISAPMVTGVTSSSANGNYTTGQTVPIQVTFSTPVTVTGTPRIILSTGSPVTTAVNYSSGSGTDTLTFDYTVAAGNTSTDLDYSSASALTLNGGTIVDAGAVNAILTLATPGTAGSLGANKAIAINISVSEFTGNITANGLHDPSADPPHYALSVMYPDLTCFEIDGAAVSTGFYPSDTNRIIEILSVGSGTITWQVVDPSIKVYVVAMKGGPSFNLYNYYPDGIGYLSGDTNFTPNNPSGGPAGISHIVFGYKTSTDPGSIIINKAITGNIPVSGTFTFNIYDAATGGNLINTGGPITVTTSGSSGTTTVNGSSAIPLTPGVTYYVDEVGGPGTDVTTYPAGTNRLAVDALVPGAAVTLNHADFTNDIPFGSIIINKAITGNIPVSGTFTFNIYDAATGGNLINTGGPITVTTSGSSGTTTVNGSSAIPLTPGVTYYVDEVGGPGTDVTTYPAGTNRLAVDALVPGAAVTLNHADFTNDIPFGSIIINKAITGNIPVSGTFTFNIYDAATGGNLINTGGPITVTTSGSSGTTTVNGSSAIPLTPGVTYYVDEVGGPGTDVTTYPAGTNRLAVDALVPGAAVTLNHADFTNDIPFGSIIINKAITGNIPVSGTFTFNIYDAATGGNLINTGGPITVTTSGSSGTTTVNGSSAIPLTPGVTYYVDEVGGPGTDVTTYPAGTNRLAVDALVPGAAVTLNHADFTNDIPFGTALIRVIKKDIVDKKVLADATFGLFYDEACTLQANDASGDPVKPQTSIADGTAVFTNLIPGIYWVKELKAPKGYGLADPVQVDLTGGTAISFVVAASPIEVEITIEDPRIPGKIYISKVDGAGNTLTGAGFTLFASDGTTIVRDEELVDGKGNLTFDKLDWDTYIVRETTTPPGFIGAADQTVTINANNTEIGVSLTFINTPTKITKLGTIEIQKDPAVAGVGFTLYAANGTTVAVAEKLTDGTGKVTFSGLKYGTYIVRETTGIPGYSLAADQTVTINSTTVKSVIGLTFVNIPGGTTTLTVAGLTEGVIQVLAFTGVDPIIPISGGAAVIAGLAILLTTLRRRVSRK